MSLEKSIEALTAAIEAHTAALKGSFTSSELAKDPEPNKEVSGEAKKAKTAKAENNFPPANPPAVKPEPGPVNKDGETAFYAATLKPAFIDFVKKVGRDKALQVLNTVGLDSLISIKGGEQREGQYEGVLAAIKKATPNG